MKVALFYHSMYSDWNHGNAHFLRGIVRELQKKGHVVNIYEPNDGWSMQNLLKYHGEVPLEEFHNYYPGQFSKFYDLSDIDIKEELQGTNLVIVHEWNTRELISLIGSLKEQTGYRLLFHDTHHRAVTEPKSINTLDLDQYDGVLAVGDIIKDRYLENKWSKRVWTWHEAADTHIFRPLKGFRKQGDLAWIGNWGEDDGTNEIHEFLIKPVKELKLKAKVYGVNYPISAIQALTEAGIEYGGWLPNYKVPEVFAKYRVTVHVPSLCYVEKLPGVPTIRPFEALACGIPLVCSPWNDTENLFTENHDYLKALDKNQMKEKLTLVLNDKRVAKKLACNGLRTISEKHTCRHRVEQLEQIYSQIGQLITS